MQEIKENQNLSYSLGRDKEIHKIVLTGGPGGGKTTVLPLCIECLLSAGYDVLNIAEAATTVMDRGINFRDGVVDSLEFQRFLLKYQLFWEDAIMNTKYNTNKPLVVLLDRSIIDGKAYINNEQWEKLKEEFGVNELDIFSRYDLVVHLVTAAYGAEHAYTCDNNKQRGEKDLEAARRVEKNVRDAYYGHLNVRYVNNSTDFNEKMQRVINVIFEHLNLAKPKLKQRKFLVEIDKFIHCLDSDRISYRYFEQTYLVSNDSKIERRLRKIGLNGQSVYYYTLKYKDSLASIKDQKISYDMYNLLLKEADTSRMTIKKVRGYFSKDNIYYTLDDFCENTKVGILEARVSSQNENVEFKEYDGYFKEITGNRKFDNYNIAKSLPEEFF